MHGNIITVRQLLNHTSGITEYTGVASWSSSYQGEDALEKQVRSFASFSLAGNPGSGFEYSNANYQVLGMIEQAVSGEAFEAYITQHIFTPLEMGHSFTLASQASDLASGYPYWFGQPITAPNLPIPRAQGPSSFITSNAADMSHYLLAMLNASSYGDLSTLSAPGVAELHAASASIGNSSAYAMGWVVDPDGSLSHTGETPSFSSEIRIKGHWGVFVVRNIAADQREQRLDEIVPGILSILNGQEPVRNAVDPSFRRIMTGLAFLLVMIIFGIILSIRRVRKLHSERARMMRVDRRQLTSIIVMLILYLVLAAGLWYMGPISNHRSITILAMSVPDQMLLLGSAATLALVGAALPLISLYLLFAPGSRVKMTA
jgi:hypothetical protein